MLRYTIGSIRRGVTSWCKNILSWKRFWESYRHYKQLALSDRQPSLKYIYPCLGDDTEEVPIEPIYFYQDAWAFEKIVKQRPKFHVDVGSHHKFVALLSKVMPVIEVDIRPWSISLDSVEFRQGSILNLPFEDAAVPSISSLCVVEHIGLGRYGDQLDPYGSEKAIKELKRVVQPNGDLYISLPVDDENRVYFNAHRAFEEKYLLRLFSPFQIVERRFIYGYEFINQPKSGFGVGCYYLKSPLER